MLDKLARILYRYERRFGYWDMKSPTWQKACRKYGTRWSN